MNDSDQKRTLDEVPLVDRKRDFDEVQGLISLCNDAVHVAFDEARRLGHTPGLYEAAGAVAAWAFELGCAVHRTELDPDSTKQVLAWASLAAAKTIAATFGADGAGDVRLQRGDAN